MISINETMARIASSISEYIDENGLLEGYNVDVVSERVFLDDYAPKFDDYVAKVNAPENMDGSYDLDASEDGYENPDQMPYQHTVIIIIKLGQGEINFAVWNCPITLQVISEENSFEETKQALLSFIAAKNFRYENGIVQTYFTPEIVASQQEMYAGFRASITVRGSLRVPEDGIVFATNIMIKGSDGEMHDYPFINFSFDHSATPDPQPFAGTRGATMTKNRQTTQNISIATYLWNVPLPEDTSSDEYKDAFAINEFSQNVLLAMNSMNRTFHFCAVSNISDGNGGFLNIIDDDFVLVNAHYAQSWGDVEAWALSFARTNVD